MAIGASKVNPTHIDLLRPVADLLEHCSPVTAALWAAECAERVLALFEAACPDDKRPREAIEGARAWARGEIRVGPARALALAAHAAARGTDTPSARLAARAAGHAVATAHVAAHAIGAPWYAVKAIAAVTGPDGAMAAADQERDWQYRRLTELMSNQ